MVDELRPSSVSEYYREEPGHLQRAMIDAAAEYVARRTVLVSLFDPGFEYGIDRATGTCISLGGRFFVATAAHPFVRAREPFRVGVVPLTTTPSREIILPTGHNHRGGGERDQVDVAWLELSEETALTLGREFLPLDGLEPRYSGVPKDAILSYGFPNMMNVAPHPDGHLFGLAVQSYSTLVLDLTTIDARFNPDAAFDIFAHYSTRTMDGTLPEGRLPAMPNAEGLSGGGFWRVNPGRPGIWQPSDLTLVGVVHEWSPDDEWFRATRICHWLQLIADDHPALRSLLDEVLPHE